MLNLFNSAFGHNQLLWCGSFESAYFVCKNNTLKNFKYGLFIVNMYMLVRRLWRKQDRMYFRRTYARTRICIRTYVSLWRRRRRSLAGDDHGPLAAKFFHFDHWSDLKLGLGPFPCKLKNIWKSSPKKFLPTLLVGESSYIIFFTSNIIT